MNKTANTYVHVGLVVDASGSMMNLKDSTISMMKELFVNVDSPENKVVIDLWQFDTVVKHLIDGEDVSVGAPKAIEGYEIGGCTALYDAIGIGIDSLGEKFAAMDEQDRPDAVIFAILTDGYENASHKYTMEEIKTKIEHQKEKYSWEFKFLAANQDAVLSGGLFGIDSKDCVNFDFSKEGIKSAGMEMCCFIERSCYEHGSSKSKRSKSKKRN